MSRSEVDDVPAREGVEAAVDAAGNGYLAVPGELLVASGAAGEVAGALAQFARDRLGPGVIRELPPEETRNPFVRVRFAAPEDLRRREVAPLSEVLAGVRGLLARRGDAATVRAVSPNHVFIGEGIYSGGPADVATLASRMAVPSRAAGEGVRVEVLDTGLYLDHPWWPPGPIAAQSIEGVSEAPDSDGDGTLDEQAGHGTFVAGLVAQEAPFADIRTRAVLSSHGVGDDAGIAAAIRAVAADHAADPSTRGLVLNLSLGGYTEGDVPPPDILAALDTLPPEVVVVAAAGNDYPNGGRPFFPAALKRVLAIGALDGAGAPAAFSNRGCWVDACALGVGVSSSFFGFNGSSDELPDPDDFQGFATWSGTSFAAPRVAGKIAAVLSGQLQDTDEPQVRHLLRRHGHPASGSFAAGAAATLANLGLVIP